MIRASDARALSKGEVVTFDIDEEFFDLVEHSIRSAAQDGYYACTIDFESINNEYYALPREQIDAMVTLLEINEFDVDIGYDSNYDVENINVNWSEYV